MKCAIHQPQFLPWPGYLHKINNTDKFVFLDNVQFRKNEFQNRNRILVAGTMKWLTVPVSFHFGDTLREIKIADDVPWRKKMLYTLDLNYPKAPYFQQFRASLANVIEREWPNLAEFNAATVRWLMKCFDIRTEIYTSSQLPELSSDPTERLIDICRHIEADTYLSGAGGHDYLEAGEFKKAGIKLEFQEFKHPIYPQHNAKEGSGFVSHLSAIDGLFNCGGGVAGRTMLNIG